MPPEFQPFVDVASVQRLVDALPYKSVEEILPDLVAVAAGRAFGEVHGWHDLHEQAAAALAYIKQLDADPIREAGE